MAKCTRKLIDAKAAKEALRILARSEASYGTIERAMKALDALPDASEGFFDYIAKEAHRTGKSPQQVFAVEWAAFVRLKDDSLWPDANDGRCESVADVPVIKLPDKRWPTYEQWLAADEEDLFGDLAAQPPSRRRGSDDSLAREG